MRPSCDQDGAIFERTVQPSSWKSDAGRAEYLAAYDDAMRLWPVPFESEYITSRFGSTHVVVSGPEDAAPLVLLHAATGFGATQWYPNVERLSHDRRVFALDYIGSAGMGTQTAPMLTRADHSDWLADVFDGLGFDQVDVVGSSQGGWLAANLAAAMPARFGRLALLAPAASLLPIRRLVRLSMRVGPHQPAWTGPPSIKAMFGGRVEVDGRIVRLLSLHLKHFRYQSRAVRPTAFDDDELSALRMPTLVLIGSRELIYDPVEALARAARLLPDVRTELVDGCGHLINMEQPDLTDDRLITFFAPA